MASLRIGRTIARMGGLIVGSWRSVGILLLAVALVGQVQRHFFAQQLGGMMTTAGKPGASLAIFSSGWYWASLVVSLLVGALAIAGVVGGMLRVAAGQRMSAGDCLALGLRRTMPVLAVMVPMWLGITLGLIALLVPGIVLLTMWALALPVIVAEDVSVGQAFGRSRALTKGSRWKILLLFVLVAVGASVFVAILGAASGVAYLPTRPDQLVDGPVATAIHLLVGLGLMLAIYALLASLYLELAGEPESLAEIFG